jgi:hypothetical protein
MVGAIEELEILSDSGQVKLAQKRLIQSHVNVVCSVMRRFCLDVLLYPARSTSNLATPGRVRKGEGRQ